MRTYLVSRDVVIDDDTIAPVHFTVDALSGAQAGRYADRGKRDIEADAGTAPAVSKHENVSDHLYQLPFAGLFGVMFPGRKLPKVKRARRNVRVSK